MLLRRRSPAPDSARRAPRGILLPTLSAALVGAAGVAAFAPLNWWPLQFIALAFLFYQAGVDPAPRRAAWIGWGFGTGWAIAGMYWLYVAMNRFGGMPAPLAGLAIFLLGAYMGLFAALATGGAALLRRRWALPVAAYLMLVLPAAWAITEWMRGWVFTGFPWAASGYAHTVSPLSGYAPVLGVFGIGLIAAVCGACLTMLTQRARLLGVGVFAALLLGGFGLRSTAWTDASGKPLTVRLVQGNVAQDEKFDQAHILPTLKLYRELLTAAPADLVAAPETAIVLFPQNLPPDYLPGLDAWSARTDSTLMYGIPFMDGPARYTNSVGGVDPQGHHYRFDKHHLVPFGEFVPPGFRWFVDTMAIPLGDFTRGPSVQPPFAVRDQLVLPNVCYEDAFGEEIADELRGAAQPATILLNVSNLAWYGETTAIPQHLQISQMRAMEMGRPMLRATNNGATAIIDSRGEVQQMLPYYRRGTLAGTVQGMRGFTPYIRIGNLGFLILSGLMLAAAWLLRRR